MSTRSIDAFLNEIQREYIVELRLYQRHHRNRINWVIHAVTIPIEWTCWLMFAAYISNLHWIIGTITAVYFILLNSNVSAACAIFQIIYAVIAEYLVSSYDTWTAISLACVMQLVAWILQVCVGHWLLERNNPAMMTKLTLNSVVLSTLMAWDVSKLA